MTTQPEGAALVGLYNFHNRFVPMILSGAKTHTIRAPRKHADRPGSTLYLYSGLRTKRAKLLMRAKCVRVESIEITKGHDIFIDGQFLARNEREALARRDGFGDFADMLAYWSGKLPFAGQIIHWKGKA